MPVTQGKYLYFASLETVRSDGIVSDREKVAAGTQVWGYGDGAVTKTTVSRPSTQGPKVALAQQTISVANENAAVTDSQSVNIRRYAQQGQVCFDILFRKPGPS